MPEDTTGYTSRRPTARLIAGLWALTFEAVGIVLSIVGLYIVDGPLKFAWLLGVAGGTIYLRNGLELINSRVRVTGNAVLRQTRLGRWLSYDYSEVEIRREEPELLVLRFGDGFRRRLRDSKDEISRVAGMLRPKG